MADPAALKKALEVNLEKQYEAEREAKQKDVVVDKKALLRQKIEAKKKAASEKDLTQVQKEIEPPICITIKIGTLATEVDIENWKGLNASKIQRAMQLVVKRLAILRAQNRRA